MPKTKPAYDDYDDDLMDHTCLQSDLAAFHNEDDELSLLTSDDYIMMASKRTGAEQGDGDENS